MILLFEFLIKTFKRRFIHLLINSKRTLQTETPKIQIPTIYLTSIPGFTSSDFFRGDLLSYSNITLLQERISKALGKNSTLTDNQLNSISDTLFSLIG